MKKHHMLSHIYISDNMSSCLSNVIHRWHVLSHVSRVKIKCHISLSSCSSEFLNSLSSLSCATSCHCNWTLERKKKWRLIKWKYCCRWSIGRPGLRPWQVERTCCCPVNPVWVWWAVLFQHEVYIWQNILSQSYPSIHPYPFVNQSYWISLLDSRHSVKIQHQLLLHCHLSLFILYYPV